VLLLVRDFCNLLTKKAETFRPKKTSLYVL